MRVLRVYHGGRDPQHRARDRALVAAGVEVTLVVPSEWPDPGAERELSYETFPIVELPVRRAGDVNRHVYADSRAVARVLAEAEPDLLDLHEEPVSAVARQWLAAAPAQLPVVVYTAQNIDKRYPPPFSSYEHRTHTRTSALYPCSRQAAAVARRKGFSGRIEVLPLGYDDTLLGPGTQSPDDGELVLALVGRLVPEKGALDAVRVLERVNRQRPARLVIGGGGPEEARVRALASSLGLRGRVELLPWQPAHALAELYRSVHVLLVPSRATPTWAEQFGRVIVEAQASGVVVAGYASGAIPEVAGEAGLLVAEGDVSALAHAVAQLVEDAGDVARRRELGLAQARDRTWTAVAARQADLYRAVLEGSPRSATEFGPTAATPAGPRPFALPLLRRGGPPARALALLIDAGAALRRRRAAGAPSARA